MTFRGGYAVYRKARCVAAKVVARRNDRIVSIVSSFRPTPNTGHGCPPLLLSSSTTVPHKPPLQASLLDPGDQLRCREGRGGERKSSSFCTALPPPRMACMRYRHAGPSDSGVAATASPAAWFSSDHGTSGAGALTPIRDPPPFVLSNTACMQSRSGLFPHS